MYRVYDANPCTLIVIVSSLLVTPYFALATYVLSGASDRTGLWIGAASQLIEFPTGMIPMFLYGA